MSAIQMTAIRSIRYEGMPSMLRSIPEDLRSRVAACTLEQFQRRLTLLKQENYASELILGHHAHEIQENRIFQSSTLRKHFCPAGESDPRYTQSARELTVSDYWQMQPTISAPIQEKFATWSKDRALALLGDAILFRGYGLIGILMDRLKECELTILEVAFMGVSADLCYAVTGDLRPLDILCKKGLLMDPTIYPGTPGSKERGLTLLGDAILFGVHGLIEFLIHKLPGNQLSDLSNMDKSILGVAAVMRGIITGDMEPINILRSKGLSIPPRTYSFDESVTTSRKYIRGTTFVCEPHPIYNHVVYREVIRLIRHSPCWPDIQTEDVVEGMLQAAYSGCIEGFKALKDSEHWKKISPGDLMRILEAAAGDNTMQSRSYLYEDSQLNAAEQELYRQLPQKIQEHRAEIAQLLRTSDRFDPSTNSFQ